MFTLNTLLSRDDIRALPIGATFGLGPAEATTPYYVRVPEDPSTGLIVATVSTPDVPRHRAEDFDDTSWFLRSLPEDFDDTSWFLRSLPEEAPRYSFREDVTVNGYDEPQFGILDREANRFARFGVVGNTWDNPDRARRYLSEILDGSFEAEALFWQTAGMFTVPEVTAPAPRVEPSAVERFGRERMLIANMVWEHVRRAGNEHYYGTLVAAGLLPDRHQVLAFRASLADDSELSDWLRELAEAANEGDMCEVYDQMCRELGLPDREELGVPREREFRVTGYATVIVRVPVSTYVTAASADAALESADSDEVEIDDILSAVRHDREYEVDTVDWEEVEAS